MIQIEERVGKLIEYMQTLICKRECPIMEYRMYQGKERFCDIASLSADGWRTLDYSQLWGGHREYFWFETTAEIPEDFAGECVTYELTTGREGQWDATNPQFTVYVDGVLRQGFDVNHRELVLTEHAEAGRRYRIVLSAFTGDNNFSLFLHSRLKLIDRRTEQYYYDVSVPFQVAGLLEKGDIDYITIMSALNDSFNELDFRKPYSASYYESLEIAERRLQDDFYEKNCGRSKAEVYCVGHTHIDCAWKWTLAVTEDKAVRSFSTVLELMRRYPEYVFMSSQPQLYQYVKKNAPEVYEQIKERVREGRWEVDGGMWVEADCNLASGEALVRQFLHGQRFFREEFGKENHILWLPDVFGYSAALPQIMKKCGLSYFMTTKINWNEFNRMPYDTFMWEGMDGSRVLTHFIPTRDYHAPKRPGKTDFFTTYNGFINPSQIMGGWDRYSQKYLNREVLNSFGYGDGGGGPTEEMLQNQRRMAKGIPGCPRTVMSTANHFFDTVKEHVQDQKYLPEWVGELYLEYHRGTYTSMARNKKYNRKSEFAYGNLESFCVMDLMLNGNSYPAEMLHEAWEVILRNQFHDILPGSSIKEVYEDSREEYERILKQSCEYTGLVLARIADRVDTEEGNLIVFYPNSAVTTANVCFRAESGNIPVRVSAEGKQYAVQQISKDQYLFRTDALPSRGYQTFAVFYSKEDNAGIEQELAVSERVLENPLIRLELNEKGQFTKIFDKVRNRELLKPGQAGNVIMTYEDRPHKYDAWDVNIYYTEKSWEVDETEQIEVLERGPVRGCVKISRKYLDSTICQYIYLYSNSQRVDIYNEIDWKQDHIFMKTLFPLDIHASEAVFDVQYGNVKRPTHRNTPWDMAKFEVCMHKWMDVSEDGFGVSLLNDCKYGCSVHDGVIGLSMLKSATYPNPDADKEKHEFLFSILPHDGDFRTGKVVPQAYELNNPAVALVKHGKERSLPERYCLASVDQPNVVIEAVKKAEDSDAVIIRLYECFNRRSSVTLKLAGKIASASQCNLLEEEDVPAAFSGDEIRFEIRPYEILTFKVKLVR